MKLYQYSLIAQKFSGETEAKDDTAFFSGFHNSVLASVDTVISDNKKNADDMIGKSISGLRGVLSPYLSTPLTSDKSDIDKALKDNFQFMMEQFCALSKNSLPAISSYTVLEESQIPLHRQIVGVIRRILKNGRTSLADAGIAYGKNAGQVYCSFLDFSDFSLLPAMHSAAHEFSDASASAGIRFVNDFVGDIVVRSAEDNSESPHTILLQWNGNDSLLSTIRGRLKTVSEQFGITDFLVVKKSFFGGFGLTYQLQCAADLHTHALGSIILSLVGDDEELEDAITTQGSLIVLEKLT
jgi:hypothetical protein